MEQNIKKKISCGGFMLGEGLVLSEDGKTLSVSGGGGSVPKPLTFDYMPEGYPTKSVQTTTLMEEQEVAFELDEKNEYIAPITNAFEIVDGQTYTINWDGDEYECVGFVFDSRYPLLGNLSIGGMGDDTGEPFIYMYNIKQHIGMFITLDTAASHTISVKTTAETVTPMTFDYMPEGYPTKSVQTTTLMEEQEVAFELDEKNEYIAPITNAFEIVDGQTYTINWDGDEYECVGFIIGPRSALGNASIVGMGNDTGEPFLYGYNTQQHTGLFATLDTAASHTISVKTTAETVTPMAEEYLPENLATKADVENVQTTANNAQTTANNAQTTANNAQTTANNAQTTANNAQTTADNAQTTAETKFQLMRQNTVTTTTTIGTVSNSGGSVSVKGLNIAVGSTIKFTADGNISGKTVWDRPVREISMENEMGGTICRLGIELSLDGETYRFINKTTSSTLTNLVIEYEKVIIPKTISLVRDEGAWLPPYLIADCLYLTKGSTSGLATLYRITIDDSGNLTATEV